MSVAEWGLALSFCPWDLNTVQPAIISLACALLVVCHRTVSFPFYSSYSRHKFSTILRPDCDKSHTHPQTKTEIKVVLGVKNVPRYPNCGVFFLWCVNLCHLLACCWVSCTIWSCSWVFIRERTGMLGVPIVTPCRFGLCCLPGCSPDLPLCSTSLCRYPGHPAVSNKLRDVPVSGPDPSQDPCSLSSGTWHWTFQSFCPQSSDTE